MTCSAFLAGPPLKLFQNILVIFGPSVSMKKASTRVRIIVAKAVPSVVMELVIVEPKLSRFTKL